MKVRKDLIDRCKWTRILEDMPVGETASVQSDKYLSLAQTIVRINREEGSEVFLYSTEGAQKICSVTKMERWPKL